MPGRRELPREVRVLAIVAFVVALGFGIVAPAIPMFASSFGIGTTAVGLAVSAFGFFRFVSAFGGARSSSGSASAPSSPQGWSSSRSPPTHRGRAAATWQGGFLLGGIAGPVAGGLLAELDPRLPCAAQQLRAATPVGSRGGRRRAERAARG